MFCPSARKVDCSEYSAGEHARQQPGCQVHGGSGGSGRGRGGEGIAGQGGSLRGGQEKQLPGGVPADDHLHEDEKGEPEVGGKPAGGDGMGIDSRGKWKLTC